SGDERVPEDTDKAEPVCVADSERQVKGANEQIPAVDLKADRGGHEQPRCGKPLEGNRPLDQIRNSWGDDSSFWICLRIPVFVDDERQQPEAGSIFEERNDPLLRVLLHHRLPALSSLRMWRLCDTNAFASSRVWRTAWR